MTMVPKKAGLSPLRHHDREPSQRATACRYGTIVIYGAPLTCERYWVARLPPSAPGFGTSAYPQEAGAIAALPSTEKECHEEARAAQQKIGRNRDLLDQLIGAGGEPGRHVDAERFRSLEVDHQLDLRGLLHR